jgi:hypothetical protein
MPSSTQSTTASVPANRAGMRDGQVSELTVIAPLKEGGGARLRAIFAGAGGRFASTSKVGTVHDMRFVFLDNDTKLLFASTYDGTNCCGGIYLWLSRRSGTDAGHAPA